MWRINKEICEKIVKDLKEGILQELLCEVKNDATLMLDFRKDYINIYYRGSMICKLKYKTRSNCYQDVEFNNSYINTYNKIKKCDNTKQLEVQGEIKTEEDCKRLVETINIRKRAINYHLDNKSTKNDKERDHKQTVVRENNEEVISNYSIVDTEYRTKSGTQFDMIAVNRKSKQDYKSLKISIIEMKYGNGAITGNSGIYDHFEKLKNMNKDEIDDLIEDTEIMIKDKIDLELIEVLKSMKNGINIDKNSIELIFFISDMSRAQGGALKEELKKICQDLSNSEELKERIKVKIFCPYLAGNVMYEQDVIDIEDYYFYSNNYILN